MDNIASKAIDKIAMLGEVQRLFKFGFSELNCVISVSKTLCVLIIDGVRLKCFK